MLVSDLGRQSGSVRYAAARQWWGPNVEPEELFGDANDTARSVSPVAQDIGLGAGGLALGVWAWKILRSGIASRKMSKLAGGFALLVVGGIAMNISIISTARKMKIL